jgi:hypothetical protein
MGLLWNFVSMPGVPGILIAIFVAVACYAASCIAVKPGAYPIDHAGPRSFEPGMTRYTRLVEFIVGLATGSIVLLGGSSVLKSGGKLPRAYGTPLVLLAMSVVFSVIFLALFVYSYEESLHDPKFYNHYIYRSVFTLGFSALFCFSFGYVWLGFVLAQT